MNEQSHFAHLNKTMDRASLNSFTIRPQPTIGMLEVPQESDELLRKTSGPSMITKRQAFFQGFKLGISCPNFSASNASDEPYSGASFSGNGRVGTVSPEVHNPLDYESPEN